MLLKVLIYAYVNNTYSSRRMEAALKENIHFMWLAGMNKPDHNTINRFRSDRLKDVFENGVWQSSRAPCRSRAFRFERDLYRWHQTGGASQSLHLCMGNAIKHSKARMEQQLKELWAYAEGVAAEELKDQTPESFAVVSAEQVSKTIEKIDQALEGKEISKQKRQKLNYAKKNWPANMERYSKQQQLLARATVIPRPIRMLLSCA